MLGFPMASMALFGLLFMKARLFPECLQLPNLGSYSHQLYSKSKLFPFVGYCMDSNLCFQLFNNNNDDSEKFNLQGFLWLLP